MDVLEAIKKRRTIRRFKSKPVPEEIVLEIVKAGQRAPSACSLQTYSIIWVKDEEKRRALWEACGKQLFILEAPVTLTICADVKKLIDIMNARGFETSLERGLGYAVKLFAIIDAILAAENMVLAAEAYGLGSVFIGSALANPRVVKILNIPKGVLPLSLLCIGYPDENPPVRPRLLLETVLFIDSYRQLSKSELDRGVEYMNEKLAEEGYYVKYSQRSVDFKWIDNVQRKLVGNRKREEMLIETLKNLGFHPFEPVK
ncbi:MAG TPA: NADPH-dependent oxidoreductase [Armatimonadetes bacterium]|nr:NADPH-dependent oxidoreductase [Armatimonadota bacterium]